MAKARAICICSTCGKEFTKTKQCKNRAEADSFEQWAKENIDTCPDCYRKWARDFEASKGLLVDYTVDLNSAYHGELREKAIFSGDSYNQREKLKEFGCKFSFGKWEYLFPINSEIGRDSDMELRIESELGAKKVDHSQYIYEFDLEDAIKTIDRYNNKISKLAEELDELGGEPEFPEEFVKLRNGRRWNGTVYGKDEKSVYFDGKKVTIDSELAKEVQDIVAKREEWSKNKKSIEKKYERISILW